MITPDPVARSAKPPLTPELMNPLRSISRSLPQLLPMKRTTKGGRTNFFESEEFCCVPATKLPKTLAVAAMALFVAGAARAGSISFNNTNDPPFNPLASLYITNLFDAYLSPAHGTDYGQGSNCGNGGTTGLDPNDASVYTGAGGWVGQ